MSKYTKIKQKNQDKSQSDVINNDLKTYISDKEFSIGSLKLELSDNKFKQKETNGTSRDFLNTKGKSKAEQEFRDLFLWMINTRLSAKKILENIKNGKKNLNCPKRLILLRIYKEYIEAFDEMYDKWNSLRLIEKLND